MIKIDELPFNAFDRLELMFSKIEKEKEDARFAVYDDSTFELILAKEGYLEIREEDAQPYSLCKLYRPTDKLLHSDTSSIIEAMTGKSVEEVIKEKTISIKDVPYDYVNALRTLAHSDGYTNYVDIGEGPWRQVLDLHGFTTGAGVNGHYAAGTKKLKELVKTGKYPEIIETITGKNAEENSAILDEDIKQTDIKNMMKTANEYGYVVLTKEEHEQILSKLG